MSEHIISYVISVVILLFFVGESEAQGKTPLAEREQFFKSGKVLELNIELGPKELDSLRREARKYVRATLKEAGGGEYKDVGVHLKGAAGSFRGIDDKPSLTINMDKYKDGQLFHGLDKFHLANSLQDPSYVQELICGELFRAAGVPASRVSHAVVSINGKKRGLYYLKEGYDKYFLQQYFKNTRGNLYDGGFIRDVDQPLQLLSGKADVKPHTDLKMLLAAANDGDVKTRFQKMEKVLDIDRFLGYLVLEVITWDWDGYPMNRNNYRIYHDPDSGRFTFFPSGMDQMFGNPGGPLQPGFQGLVARKLVETPQGQALYLKKMEDVLKNVVQPEVLGKRLDELQQRLQPVLTAVDAGAGGGYPGQIQRIRQSVRERVKSLEAQLKQVKK